MGNMAPGQDSAGNRGNSVVLEGGGELGELFGRESMEEALEQDDGFAEASIEVVMRAIEDLPFTLRMQGEGILQVSGGTGEGLFEVLDEVNQSGDFVKELRALGQHDAAAKIVEACGATTFWILKIFGVEWIDARGSAEVLCVRKHGAKNELDISGKAFAKRGRNGEGQIGFVELTAAAKAHGLIQIDAEDGVGSFEKPEGVKVGSGFFGREWRAPTLGNAICAQD